MGAVLSRLAATDGDGFTFFGSHSHSSNPLSEICLLVPFPPPSSQGFSEWRVPATSLGPMTLAGAKGGDGKEEAGEATHSETERLLGNGAATWRRHRSSTMHIFLCAVSAQV